MPEVRQFMHRHGPGTKARIALALMLYTGARGCDARKFGRQMIREGWLRFKPQKAQYSSGEDIEIPILPALAAELNAVPQDQMTFILTEYGKPYSQRGFGMWFKDRCREAGLDHCSAHGLRKAGAALAAEGGASERQLMAIYGWVTPEMARLYTAKANKRKLARAAMPLVSIEQNGA